MNRFVRWKSDGKRSWIEYEPDPRHAELIVKSLNLESEESDDSISQEEAGRGVGDVSTIGPIADETQLQRGDEGSESVERQTRPDLSYSAKDVARDMQKPTEQSMTNLKRLVRYLKNRPRLVQLFVEQTSTANVVRPDANGDSDHAVCLKARKSTTGMVLMRDAHCLRVSSHTQSAISLSSGESEYCGIVSCAAIGSGARSMLADFLACVLMSLFALTRRVDWRLAHAEDWVASGTCRLFICGQQQRVQEGDLRLEKEPGDTNVSDALTKPLDEKRSDELEVEELRVTEENCTRFSAA